jgi:hypothetical protein
MNYEFLARDPLFCTCDNVMTLFHVNIASVYPSHPSSYLYYLLIILNSFVHLNLPLIVLSFSPVGSRSNTHHLFPSPQPAPAPFDDPMLMTPRDAVRERDQQLVLETYPPPTAATSHTSPITSPPPTTAAAA